MQAQRNEQPEIFMFINSSSGGGIGQELIALGYQEMPLKVPASQFPADRQRLVDVNVYMYDLKNNQKRDKGFKRLKQTVDSQKKVILVICGGDGTVMWVTTEICNYDINHMKVPVAMLPLGTGNDFSRVLGWGKQCPPDLLDDDMAKLKKRVTYWLSAPEQNLDIWMVTAKVQDYGKFEKVANKQTKQMEQKQITKHFCNYFSIGIDGKVGYSFDLHRTGSRVGNMLVYGTMGMVKSLTKTKSLKDLTHSLKEQYLQIEVYRNNETARNLEGKYKDILTPNNVLMEEVKNNQNLLFLNINSFMAGVKDIWKQASLPDCLRGKNDFNNYQDHGDGKIEVISFGGVWSMGFQKSVGGFATKVYQGTGPFQLDFNEFPKQGKHRTYLQIDGEFIRYTHPKSVMIQKSTLSKNGQIKILKRLPLELQRGCCC